MQIKINFMKKHLYVLTALIVVLAGTMLVIGYEKGSPSTYGHTADEIDAGSDGTHGDFGGDVSTVYSFPGSLNVEGHTLLAKGSNQKKIVYIGDPIGGRNDGHYPISLFGSAQAGWGHAYMGIDSPDGKFIIYPFSGGAASSFKELQINFDDTGTGVLDVGGDLTVSGKISGDGSGLTGIGSASFGGQLDMGANAIKMQGSYILDDGTPGGLELHGGGNRVNVCSGDTDTCNGDVYLYIGDIAYLRDDNSGWLKIHGESKGVNFDGDLTVRETVYVSDIITDSNDLKLSGSGWGMIFNIDTDSNSDNYYRWNSDSKEIMSLQGDTGDLAVSGKIKAKGGIEQHDCSWHKIDTHGNYMCPDGYYVAGLCLTNKGGGCDPNVPAGGDSKWVVAGGVYCCK